MKFKKSEILDLTLKSPLFKQKRELFAFYPATTKLENLQTILEKLTGEAKINKIPHTIDCLLPILLKRENDNIRRLDPIADDLDEEIDIEPLSPEEKKEFFDSYKPVQEKPKIPIEQLSGFVDFSGFNNLEKKETINPDSYKPLMKFKKSEILDLTLTTPSSVETLQATLAKLIGIPRVSKDQIPRAINFLLPILLKRENNNIVEIDPKSNLDEEIEIEPLSSNEQREFFWNYTVEQPISQEKTKSPIDVFSGVVDFSEATNLKKSDLEKIQDITEKKGNPYEWDLQEKVNATGKAILSELNEAARRANSDILGLQDLIEFTEEKNKLNRLKEEHENLLETSNPIENAAYFKDSIKEIKEQAERVQKKAMKVLETCKENPISVPSKDTITQVINNQKITFPTVINEFLKPVQLERIRKIKGTDLYLLNINSEAYVVKESLIKAAPLERKMRERAGEGFQKVSAVKTSSTENIIPKPQHPIFALLNRLLEKIEPALKIVETVKPSHTAFEGILLESNLLLKEGCSEITHEEAIKTASFLAKDKPEPQKEMEREM
jgi:hypothetical protein